LLGVIVLFFIIFAVLRVVLPKMGERNMLFTTIKKGRIKCILVGERIRGYYCNLSDLKVAVDRRSGKIYENSRDVEMHNMFFWRYFGVVWIGFGAKPLEYEFLDTETGEYKDAESIWYKNPMTFSLKDVECMGATRINLQIQIVLKTVHAGFSFNFRDWVSVVKNQISSAIRDYLSDKEAEEVIKEKIESNSELWNEVMNINNSDKGNKPLLETVGQEILEFSVISMDYASDFKSAMEAKKKAEEQRKADFEKVNLEADKIRVIAEAELEAAKKKALAIKEIGDAENEVIKATSLHLGQSGATNLRQAKEQKEAVIGFKGNVLSINGGSIPVVVDSKKPE
jgi:hypothetical protein